MTVSLILQPLTYLCNLAKLRQYSVATSYKFGGQEDVAGSFYNWTTTILDDLKAQTGWLDRSSVDWISKEEKITSEKL